MKDLYSKEVTLNSVYFPVHIQALISNMPPKISINEKDIIENNTLFKIFTAFLDKERKEVVYKGMLNEEKFNAFQAIGIAGSKIVMKDKLYFCDECMREDVELYGESYWRVVHQVVGVYTCNKHKIKLSESKVLSNNSRVEYSFLNQNIKDKKVVEKFDFININFKYAQMVEELYKLDLKSKYKGVFDALYIDKLRERGFTSQNGSLRLDDIEEAFTDYYSEEYLGLMQSNIKLGNSWIRRFVRVSSNKQKHLLRHLLMIQFLELTIEEVFNTEKVNGRSEYVYIPNPRLDIEVQRERWLQVLKDNPGLSKSEYKRIGKGLYSWLYKNDNRWFENVTPKKLIIKKENED